MTTLITKPNLEAIIAVITQPLIGEICCQVSFSYGDELELDFGKMTPCSHPKLTHLYQGSWQLGTRATPWILKQENQILISAFNVESEEERDRAKEVIKQLEGKKLNQLWVDPNTISLTLDFENNYQLILEADLANDSELPYWELFMPTEQVLTVGPGFTWNCKSINEYS